MDTTPLCVFATKARASNRLLYGDLRRLRRDVLPTGVGSREEVEALLTLDSIERVDNGWPEYLARVVTDYVLSASEPCGVVDAETAAWLVLILSDARPKTASVIIRTLTGQAHQVDETLVALVRRGAKPWREEPRPAEHRSGFHLQESAADSEAPGDLAQDTLTIA
jgi:hypothetical protein